MKTDIVPMKPPCTFMGGKSKVAGRIVELIEAEHPTAVYDLCCGSGAISIALVNAGRDPKSIVMVDSGPMADFWRAIGAGTFDIDKLRALVVGVPNDIFAVQDYVKAVAESVPYMPEALIFLQTAAYGGKPVWHDGMQWRGPGWRTVKPHWKPANACMQISPSPRRLLERVTLIASQMKGVRAFRRKLQDRTTAFRTGIVAVIDPPYSGTTGYGQEPFDVVPLAEQMASEGAVVFVCERKPLSEEAHFLRPALKQGNVAGGHSGRVDEWISVFRPK